MLSGVSENQIKMALDSYTSSLNDRNIDRVYDELSVENIDTIFKSIESSKEKGKSGLEDCLDDENLRISTEQEATRAVKENVLGKEKMKEETIEKPER